MVICESYVFEFSVSKDMKSMFHKKKGGNREGSGTLCLALIVEDLKICFEHGRVITTLNTIKHYISFLV